MAEAEDVITDVARHATVYARDLWLRHRPARAAVDDVGLRDVARRLDVLVTATFGTSYPLRFAHPPARPTLLVKLFRRHERPWPDRAVPATDGASIWLPGRAGDTAGVDPWRRYRVAALQQGMRAHRGSAQRPAKPTSPLVADLYLLLEAHAADQGLARWLPGLAEDLRIIRAAALAARPALQRFAPERCPLERLARHYLRLPVDPALDPATPVENLAAAERLAGELPPWNRPGRSPLFKDWWTGELRLPSGSRAASRTSAGSEEAEPDDEPIPPRSARLNRRPEVREPDELKDQDDEDPGVWMVQSAAPHEHAEDPFGLQRPTDRDEETAADEFASSVEELPEARLVSTPGRPREVLLSDDPPEARSRHGSADPEGSERLSYPEWDYQANAYREPGAVVTLVPPQLGPQQWVDATLAEHRTMVEAIRRHFELLQSEREVLRRQTDGEELDIDACVEAWADFRTGLPMAEGLYQIRRPARRALAVLLLIDISGSTDGWVSTHRRVVDVEREALLLVCLALEGVAERYSVQAFSGRGAGGVTVRNVKRFEEIYDNTVARRIAALEPEQYTRAGAAIRHATAELMGEAVEHRLLLLLSDGKPNDVDEYDGRYGVEDMRQAVIEAKLQGISPFCLTIDRQAATYLPGLFGAGHYAMLPRPELLPGVLVDWMRRLLSQ